MPKITKTFALLTMEPEKAVKVIRAAYKKHVTMAKAAEALDVSVSQLRVHCRRLGFDPVEERRARRRTAQRTG